MGRFTGILGLLTMLGLAYAFSTNRRAIRVKTVAWGLGLQIAFAIVVLRVEYGRRAFQVMGDAANKVLSYSFVGSEFVFGPLGKQSSNIGFIFAFQVLPVVIFICALFAILYHVGIMQFVIRIAAWLMTRIMGASGAESLNVAASIFMGQTEAPVTIRPFLPDLTRHQRRPAHGAQHRRHVDRFPGSGCFGRWDLWRHSSPLGLVPNQHGKRTRRFVLAYRLAHRHSLARLPNHRKSSGHAYGAE